VLRKKTLIEFPTLIVISPSEMKRLGFELIEEHLTDEEIEIDSAILNRSLKRKTDQTELNAEQDELSTDGKLFREQEIENRYDGEG
jgi:hypothetical protein